ncbi:hypothetical protein AMECASPLE_014292 [Ameca splendens]|uniref:Uncharacterized protein n=1 Tax=Ameca splendens TaxID=208324 RepID=A0ABV0XEN8_9TELE
MILAQPNPPKIHEGWWAYKEVVQGSFVPETKAKLNIPQTSECFHHLVVLPHYILQYTVPSVPEQRRGLQGKQFWIKLNHLENKLDQLGFRLCTVTCVHLCNAHLLWIYSLSFFNGL